MSFGTTRIKTLVPVDCNGEWDIATGVEPGFTVWDPESGTFRLGAIWILKTAPNGVMTAANVYLDSLTPIWDYPSEFPIMAPRQPNTPDVPAMAGGTGWQTGYTGVNSDYNVGTGVVVIDPNAAVADGTMIQLLVLTHNNVDAWALSSYVFGIGDPPGHGPIILGSKVKDLGASPQYWTVEEINGEPGNVRYGCRPALRTQCGMTHFTIAEIVAVGPRDVLDDRILVTE